MGSSLMSLEFHLYKVKRDLDIDYTMMLIYLTSYICTLRSGQDAQFYVMCF